MIKILVVEFNDLCEDDINSFLENVPVSLKPNTGNNEGKRKVTPWVYYSNITLGELQRMIEYIEYNKIRLQKFATGVNTCGKFVISVCNAFIDGLSLQENLRLCKKNMKNQN
jgi:hypothetical protein